LHYLPPYSPDFNPVEMAFSKLKAALRGKAERAASALWDTVGHAIPIFTPDDMRTIMRQQDMNRIKPAAR
jgi:transposase